jgi:hypothetical protein
VIRRVPVSPCATRQGPPEVRNGRISLNVYTYGEIMRVPKVGTLSIEEFPQLLRIGPATLQLTNDLGV